MATLVFDIETAALPTEQFDPAQQEYLFRSAENLPDPEEKAARKAEIEKMMALWPFTSQVVCIAMVNAQSRRGKVLFISDDFETGETSDSNIEFTPVAEETELISHFWDAARHYDAIVTFNGRGFDVPFLYLRSALLHVPITRKNWLGYRFATEPHCDLAEQLSFYGVSGRDGAARRFNLDFYCRAFGIPSPKSQGVTGMDVSRLLQEGKYQEIADYCLRDTQATTDLYHIWKDRLSGIK